MKNAEILPENSAEIPDVTFKVIMIGNSGVGKTCLAIRAGTDSFQTTIPTLGFEIININVRYSEKVIRLQIWDTCGQEAYKSIVSKFYKQAKLCLLVFSIDNKKSFNDLDGWLSELKDHGEKNVKIALVGNKSDLDKREVTKEEELNYKIKRNLDLCFESSAKHGDNSKDIFIEGAKLIYNEYKKNEENEKNEEKNKSLKNDKKNNFHLNIKKNKKKKKKENYDEDYDYDEYDYEDVKGQQGSCKKCF